MAFRSRPKNHRGKLGFLRALQAWFRWLVRFGRSGRLGHRNKSNAVKSNAVVLSGRVSGAVRAYKYRNTIRFVKKLTAFVLIVGVVGVAAFAGIDILLYVRTGAKFGVVSRVLSKYAQNKTKQAVGFVKGLERELVVTYPGAVFLFEDAKLDARVQDEIVRFLTYKNSVYRLTDTSKLLSLQDLADYYTKALKPYGYELVGIKDLDDEQGFSGVYFINEGLDVGLRVYTLSGADIWYEIISVSQAKNYLRDRVVKILTRQARLSASRQNLDKKYKLALVVPKGMRVGALYIGGLDAYTLQFFDAQDKPVLQIIPYKRVSVAEQNMSAKQLEATAQRLLKEYLAKSGVVINLGAALRFERVHLPKLFDRTQKHLVDILTLVDILHGKLDVAQLQEYQTMPAYKLTYQTIDGQNKALFLVKGAGLWWVLVW